MEILFVRATSNSSFGSILAHMPLNFPSKIYFHYKPLTFALLAALTPNQHNLHLVEGDHENIEYKNDYDLVGISAITRYANLGYEIADRFRGKGIPVVLGGFHYSALPFEAKKHADSVVIGEAEEVWPQVLKDAEQKKLKNFYSSDLPVDPNKIPHPRMSIYSKNTGIGVQATRGCPQGCSFCSITHMKNRNKFRKRPINDVIEDIKSLKNKSFFLFDNSVTINREYTKKLFKEMAGLGKKFIAYGNVNLGRDKELLKLANEAGCTIWMIGFESVYQKTLDHIGKKTNKIEEYLSSINNIHDHNMLIIGLFAFGFDTDTIDVFKRAKDFLDKSEIDVPYFHILSPEPGTPIFKKYEKENRILTRDWSKYSTANNVVFRPKNMTPDELLNNTIKLRLEQYKTSKIIRRILRSRKYSPYSFLESTWGNIYFKMIMHTYR